MNHITLRWFSGTGNTWHAAEIIRENLISRSYQVEMKPFSTPIADNEWKTRIILAFPVYAWRMPANIEKWIKALPAGNGEEFSIFTTSGGDGAGAGILAARLLEKKGYRIHSVKEAVYPENWTEVIEPPSPEKCSEMITTGDQTVLDFCRHFSTGEPVELSSLKYKRSWHAAAGFIFNLLGRRLLGLFFTSDSACTHCGLCEKLCPTGCIKMKGNLNLRPSWGFNCINCNRCINLCPEKAIQTSLFKIAFNGGLTLLSIILPVLILLFFYPKNPYPAVIISIILYTLLTLDAILMIPFFIDPLFRLADRIPFLRMLRDWTFTRNFRRYRMKGYQALK